MDPLSALSVAETIIQFVDFSGTLFKNGRELYKSSSGASSVNQEIDLVVTNIRAAVFKIRRFLEVGSPAAAAGSLNPTEQTEGDALRRICDGTVVIAEEILQRLESLKVKGSKHRKWESVWKAVQSSWSEGEIKSLLGRLSGFKEALNLQILVYLM